MLTGIYYSFECGNAFVEGGLFPASNFANEQEAIKMAADYEATLYKYNNDGVRISTETIYNPWE